ncbi:MAG TPA: BatA domain-containing protein [Longimicrobiales bacterium]|nr:BatA domain-containing protein [Longimicrobiales bacterium]
MLTFLTPAFLAGLAALAVPLLVHLIRRERQDAVEFPSLMFMSRIPQPTVKRRTIRNWWLFALRSLAVILLVGAFARPFLERPPEAFTLSDHAGEVVIMVDRSYTMGYGDRWQRALAAARAAVDALGSNDRATLVFFDTGAEVAVSATTDRARLRAALDAAAPSAAGTRLAPALRIAEGVLAGSDLTRLEAVLISDFPRTGWTGDAGVTFPPGALLKTVPVLDDDVSNLVVAGVELERTRVSGRERVTVHAQLARHGAGDGEVTARLEVDGRVVQSVPVSVPAGGTARATFPPLTLAEAEVSAAVRAGDDALPADNVFHFVLSPDPGLRVLVVEPSAGDGTLYARRALELAQEPPVQVTVRRGGMPSAAELARADVVLLHDMVPGDDEAGRRLLEWVGNGGGVILAAGDRTLTATWGDVSRRMAGGVPASVTDRVDVGGARLGYIDYSHPVFEPFRAPRAGAFSAPRFYRYRAMPAADARTPAADTAAPAATVLARFDDGSAALVERRIGAGRVLAWGSTLDTHWSSLPLEPVYLPLLHQLVTHAASLAAPRAYHTAGQIVDVGRVAQADLLVTAPSGQRTTAAPGGTLLRLAEQGVYDVREARAGGPTVALHAVNVDVAESGLVAMDAAEVVASVTRPRSPGAQRASAITLPGNEQERRQSIWWYLLLTAFVLLTVEAVLANRRSRRPA